MCFIPAKEKTSDVEVRSEQTIYKEASRSISLDEPEHLELISLNDIFSFT